MEPDVEWYSAWRVLLPMVKASCGEPVIVTARSNVTSTSMFSPAA